MLTVLHLKYTNVRGWIVSITQIEIPYPNYGTLMKETLLMFLTCLIRNIGNTIVVEMSSLNKPTYKTLTSNM
jgi:hypothetical protein